MIRSDDNVSRTSTGAEGLSPAAARTPLSPSRANSRNTASGVPGLRAAAVRTCSASSPASPAKAAAPIFGCEAAKCLICQESSLARRLNAHGERLLFWATRHLTSTGTAEFSAMPASTLAGVLGCEATRSSTTSSGNGPDNPISLALAWARGPLTATAAFTITIWVDN